MSDPIREAMERRLRAQAMGDGEDPIAAAIARRTKKQTELKDTGPIEQKQFTRYSGGNSGVSPVSVDGTPAGREIRVARAPSTDAMVMGMKEKNSDRLAAAYEMYPEAAANKMIFQDNEGTVTVGQPDGKVLNFERPDFGQAIAGALRGLGNIRNRGTPWASEDDSLREEKLVGDLIRQNADAALPNIASRGTMNALAAMVPGGLAIRAGAAALGNASVPVLNSQINEMTPGGDSQSAKQIGKDAAIDGAIGAGSVLLPAGIAQLKRLSSAGRMNAALRDLALEEGVANPELAKQLRLTKEALPISSLANEENALTLQKVGRHKEVAAADSKAWQNVTNMGDEAASSISAAKEAERQAEARVAQADFDVTDATNRAKQTLRDARNTARYAANETERKIAEQEAQRDAQRFAQEKAHEEAIAAQNRQFAADTQARADKIAQINEADAAKKLKFNQDRAREANVRAANNSEIDEQIQAAKENYGGRYQQNRVAELEAGRPGTPYKLVPPQSTPKPPKITRPARPEKPVKPAKLEKPVAEPFQAPDTPELDAARLKAREARSAKVEAGNNVERTQEAVKPVKELIKSLKTAQARIEKAKGPGLFTTKNAVRAGLGLITHGKTLAAEGAYRGIKGLMTQRRLLKIMSDPAQIRQLQELAAKGERLPLQDTKAVESFQQELRTFLAESEQD